MSTVPHGQLVPLGGGDSIPLCRETMSVGRRESCDICLKFPAISSMHCEFIFREGYWTIRDLNSTNGIKVNGERVSSRPLRPGDEVSIAKRTYVIQYELPTAAAARLDELHTPEQVMGQSLLEKAGLLRRRPRHEEETDDD